MFSCISSSWDSEAECSDTEWRSFMKSKNIWTSGGWQNGSCSHVMNYSCDYSDRTPVWTWEELHKFRKKTLGPVGLSRCKKISIVKIVKIKTLAAYVCRSLGSWYFSIAMKSLNGKCPNTGITVHCHRWDVYRLNR